MKDIDLKKTEQNQSDELILENYEQYSKGQELLCRNYLFPKDMQNQKKIFEELGFSFYSYTPVEGMYNVILPEGWSLVPTENVLWTNIIDNKDNIRGLIYYNAVQNKSYASLKCRYGIYTKSENIDGVIYKRMYFGENDDELHIIASVGVDENDPNAKEILEQIDNFEPSAIEYANKKYPYWQDVRSYWGLRKSNQYFKK